MKRTVLITGASRGIGAACAEKFAQEGWRVIIHYHQRRELAYELASRIERASGQVMVVQADVSKAEEVDAMIHKVLLSCPRIDALVNNAGISEQLLFTDITDDQWQQMMDTNLSSAYRLCKGVLPSMIREKYGSIVQISSIWGLTGASCEVHYSASKAGLIGLTKALAKEVGLSGIRVNAVCPGVIDTDMCRHLDAEPRRELASETPLGRLGSPEEVAAAVYFFCTDEASFITGQVLAVDGGFQIV